MTIIITRVAMDEFGDFIDVQEYWAGDGWTCDVDEAYEFANMTIATDKCLALRHSDVFGFDIDVLC